MSEDIDRRVYEEARFIVSTGATVRACAAQFGVSKTTIHKDMRERLPQMDGELSRRVDEVLQKNLRERHLRGGEATRKKYSALRDAEDIPAQ